VSHFDKNTRRVLSYDVLRQKIAVFTYSSPHLCFPWRRPCDYHTWMERQFNACQTPCSMYLSIFNSFRVIRCLSQCVSPKIAFFTYRSPHFCFPWRRPCDYHTICCMDGKTIKCLPNPSQHVSTYLQHFPSYSNRKCPKSPFSRTAAHIFVSPGDTPAIITQYVARMERQFNACQTPSSMCPSIFNSFPVIRTANAKIAVFTYSSPHFCFPWRCPCDYHAICCMDGKTIQCL